MVIKKAGGGSVTLWVMLSWEALGPAIRVDVMTCTAADRVTLSWQQHSLTALASCSRILLPPSLFLGGHQWLWCWLHLQTLHVRMCLTNQSGGIVVPGLCVHVEMSLSKALKMAPKAASSVFECVRLLLSLDWLSCHLRGWKGECSPAMQRWPVKLCINTLYYLKDGPFIYESLLKFLLGPLVTNANKEMIQH